MAIKMEVIRPFTLEGKRVWPGELVDVPGYLVAYLIEKGAVDEVGVFESESEEIATPTARNDTRSGEVNDESGT